MKTKLPATTTLVRGYDMPNPGDPEISNCTWCPIRPECKARDAITTSAFCTAAAASMGKRHASDYWFFDQVLYTAWRLK